MQATINSDTLVMNVDDNDGARYVKTRILSRAGFIVVECENGEDALRFAREKKPALILLDVKLPDINGMEVCRRLKADPLTQHVLILQTSASFLGTADKIRALEGGADNYLMEPIDPDELIANVNALLRLGRVERELREVDRRKDEFIATLAHELRNPLGPIRNSVAIWKQLEPTISPELSKAREIIDRQTNHLAHLVDDLLDVSRVSSGKISLRWEPVSLKDFVESAIETAQPVIERRQHSLTVKLPETNVWVLGDRVRLAQIVSNLLLNAAKFTRVQGEIKITCNLDETNLFLQVTDNGIGISPEEMSRIFELFSQSNRAPEQAAEGLGIGLALVKALLALHHGEVRASSLGENLGSTFEIKLPITNSPERSLAQPKSETKEIIKKRILVVDDNEDAASTLAALLEYGGHLVTTAFTGKQAIERAAEFNPEIIFLDIGLPDMTGYDVVRKIRSTENGKQVICIALTGYGQDHDKQAADNAGFNYHFVKPLDFNQLRELEILA
jgi:signal transduction histidine kinase